MQKGCILTGLGFRIWRESRVALATAINRRPNARAPTYNFDYWTDALGGKGGAMPPG